MRKALSLIELIFTIVIIALVFTVIPKVVLSLSKSDSFAIRQDALFNGMSMLSMISKLPWDEENTRFTDILDTNSTNTRFDCDASSFRRPGSFIGSRNCEHNLSASLGPDGESDYTLYNDIDDFVDEDNITANPYRLEANVTYIDDNYNDTGSKIVIDLNGSVALVESTNFKRIHLSVHYAGKRGEGKQLTQFDYVSSNIGQMTINKRVW